MAVIRHLDVGGLDMVCKDVRSSIEQFDEYVQTMDETTNHLLDTWLGKGRDRFESEYMVIRRQLKDITGALYDIYDALVDAQAGYIDADEAVAKKISAGYIQGDSSAVSVSDNEGGGAGGR